VVRGLEPADDLAAGVDLERVGLDGARDLDAGEIARVQEKPTKGARAWSEGAVASDDVAALVDAERVREDRRRRIERAELALLQNEPVSPAPRMAPDRFSCSGLDMTPRHVLYARDLDVLLRDILSTTGLRCRVASR